MILEETYTLSNGGEIPRLGLGTCSSLAGGERITVLVDPQEPGSAELPRMPLKRAASWIVQLVGALGIGGLALLHGRALLRVGVHRRDHSVLATTRAELGSLSA